MTARPRARRGGATVTVVGDLFRHAVATRSWLPLVIVIFAVIAAFVVFVGHTVAPWAIYPAL